MMNWFYITIARLVFLGIFSLIIKRIMKRNFAGHKIPAIKHNPKEKEAKYKALEKILTTLGKFIIWEWLVSDYYYKKYSEAERDPKRKK